MKHTATSLALVLALGQLAAAGCREPKLSGTDQVFDGNIEMTMVKDNGLAAGSWSSVDGYMMGAVVRSTALPGCAVGIARGGELEYLQGYGKARIGAAADADGDGDDWGVGTMGAVGSVAKSLTAAGMLRMHELGLLNLNGRVGDYLPTSNGALANVFLYDILTHHSGVGGGNKQSAFAPNWISGTDAADCVDTSGPVCDAAALAVMRPAVGFWQYDTKETVAELTHNNPLAGSPHQGVYSNVGYSVAGAVIDEVSSNQESGYEAWIWNQVGQHSDPLDLGNMLSLALTHSWRVDDIPYRAVGYRPTSEGAPNKPEDFEVFEAWNDLGALEGWEGPSGGWAMTIGDLTRFAVALNSEKIVGAQSLGLMRIRHSNLDGLPNDYGMGVFLGDAGDPTYWHGGIIGGHTAAWNWWPDRGGQSLTIALMCNRKDVDPFTLRDHAAVLADAVQNGQPMPPLMPVQAPVGDKGNGQLYRLDSSSAWQVDADNAFLPITELSEPLSVELMATSRSHYKLALYQGDHKVALLSASWRDPQLASRPQAITVATTIGDVTIENFVMTGAVSARGGRLADVRLSGRVDSRQARALLNLESRALCVTDSGRDRCTPCQDGSRTCLEFNYRGLVGLR